MPLRTLLLAAALACAATTSHAQSRHAQVSREAAAEVERVSASSAYKASAGLRE